MAGSVVPLGKTDVEVDVEEVVEEVDTVDVVVDA